MSTKILCHLSVSWQKENEMKRMAGSELSRGIRWAETFKGQYLLSAQAASHQGKGIPLASSLLGLQMPDCALMDRKVGPITEHVDAGVGVSPDTQRIPYHISFGAESQWVAQSQLSWPSCCPSGFLQLDLPSRPSQRANGHSELAPGPLRPPGPAAQRAAKPRGGRK
ncbi:DnaJ subfamily C member 14 [Galemys pyrenaicus]|uniref:DnaJ subfamily C member 14 n=1 Tax=Galemys pyrenaicus TaxID=202257 RepID=A0A8J6AGK0_GALPY|nr:DnaJ subfamily C member 14 [Galemys pyrenaicus]